MSNITVIPGDILIIKDLEFRDGVMDHAINGRPCLALYGNDETVTVLLLTNQTHKINYSNHYVFYDFGKDLALVDIERIYNIPVENVLYPIRNIGKDYFRIIGKFQDFNAKNKDNTIKKCCYKLRYFGELESYLKPVLNERYMELKNRSRDLRGRSVESDEDQIEKKLTRSKMAMHKKNKQQLSITYLE